MIGVVKIGGAEGNELGSLMSELAARVAVGEKWILVHGASGIMDRLCRERGVEIRMVTSPSGYRSRYVGEKERELFREAALAYGDRIKSSLADFGASAEFLDPETTEVSLPTGKTYCGSIPGEGPASSAAITAELSHQSEVKRSSP